MKELEERILKEGKALPGDVLLVGSFLNQNIDTKLLKSMAKETKRLFDEKVTKVLTIEASGLPFACMVAYEFDAPMLFAKKSKSSNLNGSYYTSSVKSYTHNNTSTIYVNKEYLSKDDYVLICDDFLANGCALQGLIDLVNQSGAHLVGCAIEIEKAYQPGGELIRSQGIKVESLAKIASMDNSTITFK